MFLCDLMNFLVLMFGFSAFSVRNIGSYSHINHSEWTVLIFPAITEWWWFSKLLKWGPSPNSIFVNVADAVCVIDHWSSTIPSPEYERKNHFPCGISDRCSCVAVSFHAFVPWSTISCDYLATNAVLFHQMRLLPSVGLPNTVRLPETCFRQLCQQWILLDALASVWIVWLLWANGINLFMNHFVFVVVSHYSYQMIPFLTEARTLLDWICIKTSLTLYEWFKMEDIYSDMFSIKVRKDRHA